MPGPAEWTAFAGAALAASVAYTALGVSRGSDVPAIGLAVASLALLVPLAAVLLRGDGARAGLSRRRVSAAAAFVIAVCASAAWSPHRWTSFFGAETSGLGVPALIALATLVLAAACLSARLRVALLAAAPFVVAVEAVLAVRQYAGGLEPQGTLANSSYMGQVVVLMVPLVLGPALGAATTRQRAWRWAVALAGLATLLLSTSYAAAFAVAGYLLYLAVRRLASGLDRRTGAAATGAAGVVACLIPVVALATNPALAESLQVRTRYWEAGVRAFLASPLLGWGPDSYRAVAASYAPAGMLEARGAATGFSQIAVDPHNALVWTLCTIGVMGAAAVAWCAVEVVGSWRAQESADGGPDAFAVAAVLYAVTLLYAPAPLQTLVLAGLVLGASLTSPAQEAPRGAGGALVAVGVAAAAVCLALGGVRVWVGSHDTWTAADAARARTAAALVSLDPYLQYYASIAVASAAPGGADGADLALAKRAAELDPADPVYALELARTRVAYGDAAGAHAAYRRAIELFPNSYEACAGYARFLAFEGDAAGSARYAARAADILRAAGGAPTAPGALTEPAVPQP